MKNLIVIRHAKSNWDDPSLADIDRPLNKRGLRDAPFMGGVLKFRDAVPDLIVTSPARRALETARLIAREVGCAPEAIDIRRSLYLADLPVLAETVRGVDDSRSRVYLIGHNPEFSELVEYLTGKSVGTLPTCGVASIEFKVDSWGHIMAGSGRLAWLDHPKRHL
jgi:phosphohistidine phosphatase